MPELPEVQTIVSDLKKILPGLKIRGVWTDFPKMIKAPKSFVGFKKDVIAKKVLTVERKGKNILVGLSGNRTLLMHLKMTGYLVYRKPEPPSAFIHLVFSLSDGKELAFSDVRKFAKALVWPTDKLSGLKDIKDIGPNPLDASFTFKKFRDILQGKHGKIKDILMRQDIISGIGNIYSSEILWEAGIYPFKDWGKIKEAEQKELYKAIKKILKQGVKLRGDSIVDYRDAFGQKGRYQNFHKAYQREGYKCLKKDGGVIKRIKKGGRSAFFCPRHQRP
jgi:formamidopyrimidine-DNA glycosylase